MARTTWVIVLLLGIIYLGKCDTAEFIGQSSMTVCFNYNKVTYTRGFTRAEAQFMVCVKHCMEHFVQNKYTLLTMSPRCINKSHENKLFVFLLYM